MKPLQLLALLLVMATGATAQTVNNVPLQDINAEYAEIVGDRKMFSSKLNIYLDFGQHISELNRSKHSAIKDENGKALNFNSMVDALNFMAQYGWELVQAYAVATGDTEVYHYLLRRKE